MIGKIAALKELDDYKEYRITARIKSTPTVWKLEWFAAGEGHTVTGNGVQFRNKVPDEEALRQLRQAAEKGVELRL